MNENPHKTQLLNDLKAKIADGDIQSDIFDSSKPLSTLPKPDQDSPHDENSSSKKALDYSLRILAGRDYSIHKMKEKLKLRGFTKNEIVETVEKLQSLSYLREEEYTKSRVKQLLLKGYSNSYVKQKLEQEYLSCSDYIIEEIRSDLNLDLDSQISSLIDKKLKGIEIPTEFNLKMKLRDKTARFLISKGFNFTDIGNHLNEKFK